MGQSFSSRRDLYVHQFINPRVTEQSTQIMVRGVVQGNQLLFAPNQKPHCNPFASLVSERDESQEIIILGLYAQYISNELSNTNVELVITNLFSTVPPDGGGQDVRHMDDSGVVRILCPAGFNRAVEGNDRILYRPRLKDEYLRAYAGLDDAILRGSSIPVGEGNNDVVLLELTHPLVHFILTNQELLEPEHGDVTKHAEFFEVKPEFLARVRQYYSDSIHKDMRPTRFENTQIGGSVNGAENPPHSHSPPNVTIILKIDYLIVVPGERKMKHMEIKV